MSKFTAAYEVNSSILFQRIGFLLKNPNLDKTNSQITIQSLISLSYVKCRLTDHLTSNGFSRSSSICLLQTSLHWNSPTVYPWSSHQWHWIHRSCQCRCLLDLSAAFDTIDHNILITRLSSGFGIHGSLIPFFPCTLWRLLFRAYFFLQCFSMLCSRSSTFRHVYHRTEHSHLLTFSKPSPLRRWYSILSHSILLTLTRVSPICRLLYNRSLLGCPLIFLLLTLLRLNSHYRLKKQLSKSVNSSLNITHSARNLCLFLISISPLPTRFHPFQTWLLCHSTAVFISFK